MGLLAQALLVLALARGGSAPSPPHEEVEAEVARLEGDQPVEGGDGRGGGRQAGLSGEGAAQRADLAERDPQGRGELTDSAVGLGG